MVYLLHVFCASNVLLFKPDFSEVPLMSGEAVNNWLQFYDMKPTLVCVGELVSHDPVSLYILFLLLIVNWVACIGYRSYYNYKEISGNERSEWTT